MDFIFFFFLFSPLPHLAAPSHHICLHDQKSALWDFKNTFTIATNLSKTSSWTLADDCCSWPGVECDRLSGHVIALDLANGSLSGPLTSNNTLFLLRRLQRLNLAYNDFELSSLPSEFSGFSRLTYLNLSHSRLSGHIPDDITRLSHVTDMFLGSNELSGEFSASFANLTRLRNLDLSLNKLHGSIPTSISKLGSLRSLDLYGNEFNGTVDLDMFGGLEHLYSLDISLNKLSLLVGSGFGYDLGRKYEFLGFASCNLTEFPGFLRDREELVWLDLSDNGIRGEVPRWIWNSSFQSLDFLNLSRNFLTGFEDRPRELPWARLRTLDISFNFLRGPIVIPPISTNFYLASNNRINGGLSDSVCDLIEAIALDLSYNNLSGTVPQCLGRLSKSLSILNLQGNHFRGGIPGSWIRGCLLRMINLSENEFESELPKSLANCTKLEFMDLGLNRLTGKFPYWLGAQPELRVLCLRHNRFSGAIDADKRDYPFGQLRILDLSFNRLSGSLPRVGSSYWSSMKTDSVDEVLTYMNIELRGGSRWGGAHSAYYDFSMKVTNKGMERVYRKIPNIFRGIDLSNNEFMGGIPPSFENLRGIHLLTLGSNRLSGVIPQSVGQLLKIESLDLSDNELSGEIPRELVGLTSLSFFNVSHNDLVGAIPRGNQFDTFENSSFEGNVRLCGDPLIKKCVDLVSGEPTSKVEEEEEEESWLFDEIGLIVIFTGFGGGLVVGVIIGIGFVDRKLCEKLLNIFKLRKR